MYQFINSTINSVLTLVNNAVVFVDDATAEVLHWCNGLSKLLDAGALAIRDIKHAKECLESENKCVFLISTPLNGQVSKYIQRIVKNSDFNHCIISSSLSSEMNEFISNSTNQLTAFDNFCHQLRLWMQNEFATTTLHHIPFSCIEIVPDFFITPIHNSLFPVLPSDVARLQAFLYSRGDKRIFNNLGDVDVGFLPHNMRCQIKMLASTLNSMFESMSIHEDCYAVGHFSRLVATELANMPDARGRRKLASSRASIVFVDRTLDLVAPISHTSDCVLGSIYEILPLLRNQNNDVAIDMKMLFADGNSTPSTLFPGCFAYNEDEEAENALQMFIKKSKKECLKYVCEKLKIFLHFENIVVKNIDEGSTLSSLKALLKYFKNNIQLLKKYSGVLQCAVALVNALTDTENEHLDELLSAEKVILLDVASGESDPFSQILRLLSKKDSKRFSVVDALMFCLFIYSAGDDVSNTSAAYEAKLKEALINILMDGNHKEDILFLIGDLDASERQVRTRMADIFERLRGIGEARKEMQQLRSVFNKDDNGVMKYKPIVAQILELIFDPRKPELQDIEFRSHGFKDFLKTGFGFFMNVSKPRPEDHPVLLFVIGGITWNEVKCVKETLAKLKPNQKVTIASTRLLTPSVTLEQVLCLDNLYVDVET
ncbi:sec1 family domain-containing protein 2-like [Hydractinia symbiolongicarpus]|uniref:sec1 family domain-containing protein 2-like n=1 Tax=Hydractinia symbiolongicarpus TaxID=13093 RepID=UPI002549D133|nr:sec1 family domain-containing protein 2-like [Hydractinia symbiolongicarpus]